MARVRSQPAVSQEKAGPARVVWSARERATPLQAEQREVIRAVLARRSEAALRRARPAQRAPDKPLRCSNCLAGGRRPTRLVRRSTAHACLAAGYRLPRSTGSRQVSTCPTDPPGSTTDVPTWGRRVGRSLLAGSTPSGQSRPAHRHPNNPKSCANRPSVARDVDNVVAARFSHNHRLALAVPRRISRWPPEAWWKTIAREWIGRATVNREDFDRLIISHGMCAPSGAHQLGGRAFSWVRGDQEG